jgi:hypothetical protein
MTGTLGQNANRETVAEILFQAILVNMVDHNILNTNNGNQGYTEIDETLGYKTFKLEQVEGVVTGNEFADLNSTQVLPVGQTQLQVEGEENLRSLAISTEITDIGESRYAYITGAKVLAMGDTGLNKVTETGAAVDITTNAKFQAAAEMPAASGIEYYVNFGRAGTFTCDQRLEFVVTFTYNTGSTFIPGTNNLYGSLTEIIRDFELDYVGGDDLVTDVGMTRVDDRTNSNTATYSKVIRANADISDNDLAVIRGIFAAADNNNNSTTRFEGVEGDVFVGTFSTNATNNEERDLSNQISYRKFVEDYINDETFDVNWENSFNGDWVKFVDNNGDGQAEYAFYTTSWLDEVVGTYTNEDGDTIFEYNRWNFDDDNDPRVTNDGYNVRYMDDYKPAVGDKVICALIDNQILVEPAKSENVTVSDYSWREDKITTDKGEFGQSGIGNATDMQQRISGMEDKVEYTVYFDHFGYIRAYELPGGTQYALVTELYYTNGNNGNMVQSWPMTAELKVGDADKKEYTTSSSNVFNTQLFLNTPWLEVRSIAANRSYYNWLQPAIAHLGVGYTDSVLGYRGAMNGGVASVTDPSLDRDIQYNFWNKNYQAINQIVSFGTSQEFRYGTQQYDQIVPTFDENVDVANTTSFTNVAVVNVNDDTNTATLAGAAKLHVNQNGVVDPSRYDVDYIQLSTADIASGAVRYNIANNSGDADYVEDNNYFVNAVHDTEYYIVYNGDVFYCKDYVNFPGLTNKDNNIHAAYAVARDTRSDNADKPYWVADVIVYEVETLNNKVASNIALAYYTQQRNTGSVQLLKTLNSKVGPMVDLVPGGKDWSADLGQWGTGWESYGFYTLYNTTEPVDNVMSARSIELIDDEFNKNGIYAGTIIREVDVTNRGDYIVVDLGDGRTAQIEVTDKIYSITRDHNWDGGWNNEYNTARQLRYKNTNSSEVKTGDRVIWVGTAATNGTVSTASFVVDLGNWDNNWELWNTTAPFLAWYTKTPTPTTDADPISGLWKEIVDEQIGSIVNYAPVSFNLVLGANETAKISVSTGDSTTVSGGRTGTAPAGTNVQLQVPDTTKGFTLTVELTGKNPVNMAAIVVNNPWVATQTVLTKSNAAGTEKTYTVVVGTTTNVPFAALAEDAFVKAEDAEVRIYTDNGVTDLLTFANTITGIGDGDKKLVYAEAAALEVILNELNTALPAGTLKDNVGTAATTIGGYVDGVTSELETALTAKQNAAKAAVDEAAAGYTEDAAVAAAITALKNAIDACTVDGKDASDIATYWDGTALVANQTLVKALTDAVAAAEEAAASDPTSVANVRAKALEAVNALVGNTGSVQAVADAKAALVAALEACTSVNADGVSATSKLLSTYCTVNEETGAVTLKEDQALVAALKSAVEAAGTAAEAEAALNQAKIDAKDAITTEVGKYGDVEAVKTAVNTLVAAIEACEVGGTDTKAITTYYTNGALVTSQPQVKAVLDAVDAAGLAANKDLAKVAVDALFTEAGVAIPTDAGELKTAYDAVINAINACTVNGSDGTLLSTYWTENGLVKTQDAIKTLIEKIEAAKAPVT